jgi:hypothetical protein
MATIIQFPKPLVRPQLDTLTEADGLDAMTVGVCEDARLAQMIASRYASPESEEYKARVVVEYRSLRRARELAQ